MKKALSLAVVLATLLAMSALTAPAALAEGETLTMLQRLPATYVVEDNPVIKAWGDLYGITIEIEAPPISSFNDRRNVIMASGDLPDLMYVGDTGALYTQWSKEGLFLNLDPYFNAERTPNAFAVLNDDELFTVKVLNDDGSSSLYSLPRVQTKPQDVIIYRADWLEKLGLEVPTTAAEFAVVVEAFATRDPDGNGADDTFGWSLNTVMGPEHRSLLSAFGTHPMEVPEADGSYKLLQQQPAYIEYLAWCRDMYSAGALDPEFYVTKMYEDDDVFLAGKMGVIYNSKVTEHLAALNDPAGVFQTGNPGAKVVAGPPLRLEGETVADVWYNPQVWGNYAINADSDLIDLALKVLDDGYTDKVNELLLVGLEGVTYTTWDPETRFAFKDSDEIIANATSYCASYATINYQRQDKGLLVATANTPEQLDVFNGTEETVRAAARRVSFLSGNGVPGYGDIQVTITEVGIPDAWGEIRTKYITGEASLEELQAFINDKYVPAYQPLLDLYAAYNDGAGFNK
ncbi:MAG: extracellular solute-binding protein [Oscillospiraceae bacterium]|jgi:ABC-type glycerol-3-phosphate transport system substrate-binding protein|nr:extracellular solute-binding protein [Oscillospiraceae bacterium]